MRWKKNEGLHTAQADAEMRILQMLFRGPCPVPSALGYAAYPNYRFNRPQGAAFAVAKILSSMCDRKLIRREHRGFSITTTGVEALAAAQARGGGDER